MILADDDGAYIDANPAACELTGYERDELLAMHAWDLAADEAGTDAVDALAHVAPVRGGREMRAQFPIRRQGRPAWSSPTSGPSPTSCPGVHLSTMRDITDRARRGGTGGQRARFRTMAESAQDAIYRLRVEPELAFEYLNPAVTAISGFPVEAFHANPFLYLERAHPEDAPKLDPSRLSPGTRPRSRSGSSTPTDTGSGWRTTAP